MFDLQLRFMQYGPMFCVSVIAASGYFVKADTFGKREQFFRLTN